MMTATNVVCIFVVVLTTSILSCRAHAVPPIISAYLEEENHRVTEDGMLPYEMPGSMDFVREVTANWKQILNELPNIAPDPRRQSLLIVAAEFLPPKDYVAFVDGLCALRSRGQLTPDGLLCVLWAKMLKDDFLAYNYDQPEVSMVVAKLEVLVDKDYPNEGNNFFAKLKSGEMKARLIERRAREGEKLPEPVVNYDETPYRQLMGGSINADVKLLAQHPMAALTSIASTNRNRWSMGVAVILMLGAVAGVVVLILRFRRRDK